eukprot:1136480-Pelagomonas_calceolata.AAC.2
MKQGAEYGLATSTMTSFDVCKQCPSLEGVPQGSMTRPGGNTPAQNQAAPPIILRFTHQCASQVYRAKRQADPLS